MVYRVYQATVCTDADWDEPYVGFDRRQAEEACAQILAHLTAKELRHVHSIYIQAFDIDPDNYPDEDFYEVTDSRFPVELLRAFNDDHGMGDVSKYAVEEVVVYDSKKLGV